MPPSSTAAQYETQLAARLAALETKLGVASTSSQQSSSLSDRLTALEQRQATVLGSSSSTQQHLESLQLLQELDPGVALTHQQQPLLYRRQQVLAASAQLQADGKQLQELRHVLRIPTSDKSTLTEEDVLQAPLLEQNVGVSPEDERRLDSIQGQFANALQRTQAMQGRIDQLLEAYHVVMVAASEKVVLMK